MKIVIIRIKMIIKSSLLRDPSFRALRVVRLHTRRVPHLLQLLFQGYVLLVNVLGQDLQVFGEQFVAWPLILEKLGIMGRILNQREYALKVAQTL